MLHQPHRATSLSRPPAAAPRRPSLRGERTSPPVKMNVSLFLPENRIISQEDTPAQPQLQPERRQFATISASFQQANSRL